MHARLHQTAVPDVGRGSLVPGHTEVDERLAPMALDACSVCAPRDACREYAVAADEFEGI